MMVAMPWLLVGSAVANALLGWAWLDERDKVTRLQEASTSAAAAAAQCNADVDKLEKAATTARRNAAAAREAAAKAAAAAGTYADAILATPPSTPGDDCRSAQDQVRSWLQGRAAP